jgi:hypothetical protein
MMNILKTFGRSQTANADTLHVLDIEELEVVSGGFDRTALDPTNPLCPGPRWHPDFSNHHKG